MLTTIIKLTAFALIVYFVCYYVAYLIYWIAGKSLARGNSANYFRANGSKQKQIMELGIMNQNLVTLFFVAGVAIFAAQTLGYISTEVATAIIGLLGFGGIAGLRAFIDSQGWKTYAVAAIGCAGILALSFGVISIEQLTAWLAGWGIISGAAINHAIQKTKAE